MAQQRQIIEPNKRAESALDVIKKCNAHGFVGFAYGPKAMEGDSDLEFVKEAEMRGWITWAWDIPPAIDGTAPHRSIFQITAAGRQALADEPKCGTCHAPLGADGLCPND